MKQSIKQTKNENDKKIKRLLHSPEYVAFQGALGKILKVTHSDLAERIKNAKRPVSRASVAVVK